MDNALNYNVQNIIDTIPISVYWKDLNGVYLGCNKYLLDIGQVTSLVGKTDYDLPWKSTAEKLREHDRYVIENDTLLDVEEYCTNAAGEALTMISRKVPLRNDKNEIIGVLGVSFDVTRRSYERYLTGDSLLLRKFLSELTDGLTGQHNNKEMTSLEYAKEIKNYYESIISYMPSNVYWLDKNGILLGGNDNVVKMFGLQSREQLVGLGYEEMAKLGKWPEGLAEAFRKTEEEVMRTGIPQLNVDEPPGIMGGAMHYYMSSKAPLRNLKNEIIGVIGISTDITERKKMENALRHEKERAEAANQAKTAFLENMRHDLRTPLTGIVGFANILKEEIKDKKLSEYIDNLIASSNLLADLINEILEAIKVSSGGAEIVKARFDFKNSLNETVILCKNQENKKNVKFSITLDENVPTYIVGDAARINRILQELIKNALKFTDNGYVRVNIMLVDAGDENPILKVVVEDTGIGIPQDKQEEIFERFNRLSPSYKGIYKGAGLGLSIVKQFVNELNGEISLKSEIGKGSTFTCFIPVEVASQDDDAIEAEAYNPIAEAKKENLQTKAENVCILLIEDDELAGRVASVILKNLSCVVDIAKTGREAIALAAQNSYDLIFMDIGLPDITGYEVTQKIRENEFIKDDQHVPVIALSAHVDIENKQKCMEMGMDAVLRKPLMKHVAQDILHTFVPRFPAQNLAEHLQEDETKSENKDLFTLSGEYINFNKMLVVLGNNDELAKEMLFIMVKNLPKDVAELKKHHEKGDWKVIKDVTHKLRGSASYCGTERLREACANLENNIISGEMSLNDKLFAQLLHEIKMVQSEYQKNF